MAALYDPELYALTHRGTTGDTDHYLRRCADASSVLELGCGWGRIALPLVRAGVSVVGVDVHPGLLARARRRAQALPDVERSRLELVEADMRSFSSERRFGRVIIPYNGLYCLLTDDDVRACFRVVRRHLEPDGLLLLDGYSVDGLDLSDAAKDFPERVEPHHVMRISRGDRRIDVYERSDIVVEEQRADTEYTYVIHTDGQGDSRFARHSIPQRFLFTSQVESLLRDVDLELVELTADFVDRPYRPGCDQWVATAAIAR